MFFLLTSFNLEYELYLYVTYSSAGTRRVTSVDGSDLLTSGGIKSELTHI